MNETPVAGVDVSKEFSDMCILAPDNTVFERVKVYHDKTSMGRAVKALDRASRAFGEKPVVVMESTSHYHRLLCQFLTRHRYHVVTINPLQSSALKNINIRKIKNDRIDAYRLALLYRTKALKPNLIPSDIIENLRMLTRQHQDMKHDLAAYEMRLQSVLDQTFPGFDKIFRRLTSKTALVLLEKYPTPESVHSVRTATLAKLIRENSRKGEAYSEKKARELKATADRALEIHVTRASAAVLVRAEVTVLKTMKELVAQVDAEIQTCIKADDALCRNVELLCSIPGIAAYSASVILAEIGDFTKFPKAKKLVAFFGLDPSIRQSGKFSGTENHISKRGSKYLRATLSMVVRTNISRKSNGEYFNPILADYYLKKCETKLSKVACCAVMHKLINIIFAVLRDQKPFVFRAPEEHLALMLSKTAPKAA